MTDAVDPQALPQAEFAFPGPLRDQLVGAILDGSKTSTTSLLAEYENDGEPLPEPGSRSVVVDSEARPVAIIEVTGARVVALAEVDESHARDEGEGHRTVAEWRAAHESFWHCDEVREELGDPAFVVEDDTRVVLERFRVVADLRGAS